MVRIPGLHPKMTTLLMKCMNSPESPPIKGLFSKCSINSLKHENVPIPNLYCEPSQPIWKCLTELAHLRQK